MSAGRAGGCFGPGFWAGLHAGWAHCAGWIRRAGRLLTPRTPTGGRRLTNAGPGLRHAARLLLAVCLWLVGAAQAEVAVPPLAARVTDLTGTLSAAQKAQLEQKLAGYEARTGTQVAVLMVPTTGGEPIEAFGIRVAEAWRVGRKGVDDGVILLVAKNDRSLRVEVGYGLEGAIPDAVAKRIVSEVITPRFKRGEFYAGLDAGVDAIFKAAAGEALPAPAPRPSQTAGGAGGLLPFALFGVFVFGGLLRSIFGRLPGALVGGGGLATLLWLSGSAFLAVALGLFAFFAILAGGGRGRRGGFIGGLGGGFGGGGFGGGGSGWGGGGGGGFGGGGASGRW